LSDYIDSQDDLHSLASSVESYFENSTRRVDKVIEKFCASVSKEKAKFDYGGNLDELAEDIIEDINASGEIEEFLEYMSDQDPLNPTYDELKEKYFPTTPEGTYGVDLSSIKNSKISDKPEQASDPTIKDSGYIKILNAIHISGTHIEQTIDSFIELDEEGLRDTILTGLKTGFPEYSTTGESFNAEGKTDILLKHENSNLFVAECKIWNGQKNVNKSIDQLMKYLTWRDSKVAVILFIETSNFSSILSNIQDVVEQHPNHKKFVKVEKENLFHFEFSLKKDPEKTIKLAVFCFDFYQKKKS